MGDNPEQQYIPESYYDVPIRALQPSTRHQLGLHLNLVNDISYNDWRIVAERIGMQLLEIQGLEQNSTNPTSAVLLRATQKNITVGAFLKILLEKERYDIFEDIGKKIEEDVKAYRPIQLAEASSSSEAPLTLGELKTGKKEYFDAFTSYHTNDWEFLQELIERLEKERGFKLCIPDRDLCAGLIENDATAKLIKSRCKRVIIVLSASYIGATDLEAKLRWQLQVAQSLAPVADTMHKLVPVVIDAVIKIPEDVPEILLPYNVCDYARPTVREWFWERMELSLAAPTTDRSGYKGPRQERLGKRESENSEQRTRSRTDPITITASNGDRSRYQRSESDIVRSQSTFYRETPSLSTRTPKKKHWWSRKD
ncbi:myeloid differentiation primary response protein MyD88-like [Watersipora subatra]|uniref:myeloid differentiation primary response protein MyD88-like n=1 Tax=Watersipora subatra TaxID=2589382 RepID=UPI00355AFF91